MRTTWLAALPAALLLTAALPAPAAADVRFLVDGQPLCAGARIAPALVITTAHCANALRTAIRRRHGPPTSASSSVIVAVDGLSRAGIRETQQRRPSSDGGFVVVASSAPLVCADLVDLPGGEAQPHSHPPSPLALVRVRGGEETTVMPVLARLPLDDPPTTVRLQPPTANTRGFRDIIVHALWPFLDQHHHRVGRSENIQLAQPLPPIQLSLDNAHRAAVSKGVEPKTSYTSIADAAAALSAEAEGTPIVLRKHGRLFLVGLATRNRDPSESTDMHGARPIGFVDLTLEKTARYLAAALAHLGLPDEQLPVVVVDQDDPSAVPDTSEATSPTEDLPVSVAPSPPAEATRTISTVTPTSRAAADPSGPTAKPATPAGDSPTASPRPTTGSPAAATSIPPTPSSGALTTTPVAGSPLSSAGSTRPTVTESASPSSPATTSPAGTIPATSGNPTQGAQTSNSPTSFAGSASPPVQQGSGSGGQQTSSGSGQNNPGSGQGQSSGQQQGSGSGQQSSTSGGQQGSGSGSQPNAQAPGSFSGSSNGGSGETNAGSNLAGGSPGDNNGHSKLNPGTLAGSIVGGIAAVCVIGSLAALAVSRSRQERSMNREHSQKDWRQYLADENSHNHV